jgi:putative ABC transport system permease protein
LPVNDHWHPTNGQTPTASRFKQPTTDHDSTPFHFGLIIGAAKVTYCRLGSTFGFLRPGIVFWNKFSGKLNQGYMFKSYVKIMMRNVTNQKFYSAITVLGLTVGITFAMLIGVFVWGELQVNKGLKDVDRLYLLKVDHKGTEGNMPPFFVPALLGQQAIAKYPGVFENYYRFYDRAVTVSKDNKHFRIQSMIGDSTLLEIFGLPVLHGPSQGALDASNSIVITEKIARQYFDRPDVVGESLTVSNENGGLKEFLITAVIADLQEKNSVSDFMNMDAQVFLSRESRNDFSLPAIVDWNTTIITYIKLSEGTPSAKAETILNTLLTTDAPLAVSENKTIKLDPLSNYYLLTNHGAVQKLIISLTVIVLFILVLAITNFINISVARSFSRLKEVGVRKVIGGVKAQIVVQFLSESLLFATFSGVLSLLLYQALRGHFGEILDVSLPSLMQLNFSFWILAITGVLLVGALAGSYPSIYLSGTKTTESLKGKFKSVKGTIRFSRALIAVQFLIAIFIFTLSFIFSRQISYFMEADLGYNRSLVMVVSSVPRIWSEEGMNTMDVAKREFLLSPRIKSASLSWGSPNFTFSPYSAKINRTGYPIDEGILASMSPADEHYARVYGLDVIAGKFLFEEGETRLRNQLVINESAQKALSVHVGDKVKIQNFGQEFTIAGIVKDFNFESLHQPVKPVAFLHTRDFGAFRYFSFKLNPGNINESVQEVERLWKKSFPNDPFVYGFTDERLALIYKTELQLKKASVIGAVLILIIVLTGVLGLISLSVAKRSKEIGIRKVLGASVSNILVLLSQEYAALMAVSFIAGIPLSYLFGLQWLNNFAYHIDLAWWMFVAPIVFLFFITICIVVAQSLITAISNPVKSLKYE